MLYIPFLVKNEKVNSARDCIEACNDDDSVDCFTGCVNTHWPGSTFEDAGNSNDVIGPSVASDPAGTSATSDIEVVIPVGGVAAATSSASSVNLEDTTSPFLLTVFAGGKSTATIPAVPLVYTTSDETASLTAVTATDVPTDSTFLNTMSPTSFETSK